jgi:hypothetical protein
MADLLSFEKYLEHGQEFGKQYLDRQADDHFFAFFSPQKHHKELVS